MPPNSAVPFNPAIDITNVCVPLVSKIELHGRGVALVPPPTNRLPSGPSR
jgi:hypothetical protein